MGQFPEDLLEREITAICQRYKITPESARTIAEHSLQRRPDLVAAILARYPHEDVTRLRVYKTLIKEIRKQVYYHVRQYQPEQETMPHLREQLRQLILSEAPPEAIDAVIQQLFLTHVSTKERMAGYDRFYHTLFELIEPPHSILDIGCGLHPLSYPFTHPAFRPDVYAALDRKAEVFHTLSVFAPHTSPTQFLPICCDIAEADWKTLTPKGEGNIVDLVFMLKLIPVIARQQRHLLPKLAAVPARQILITASTESMTRKQNIRRREDRVLRDFISRTKREITATFQVGQEFGYLLGEFS